MNNIREHDGAVHRHGDGEFLRIEPWGPHAFRVRATAGNLGGQPGALDELRPDAPDAELTVAGDTARIVNGRITAELDEHGVLRFLRTSTGDELLAESDPPVWMIGPRTHSPLPDGSYRLEQRFRAYDDEKVFGLGQYPNGRLDQKGLVLDLVQRNTQITIPFLVSSRGYGFLWNNPAQGRVELAAGATRWTAGSAGHIDYWITAGDTPAEILSSYADATGHAPEFPDWATGFWQSKLRYRTQEELLDVAREHKRRELPLSVIVCDFFHWRHMGDWSFDPESWPDPEAMAAELAELGVRLLVSVWPTVHENSAHYDELRAGGHLVGDVKGGLLTFPWPQNDPGDAPGAFYYDATDPAARRALWTYLREGYHRHGIRTFWLDACEPDLPGLLPERAVYHLGTGTRVGNYYPYAHSRAVYEGMRSEGETEVVSLIRSAWAGSQRWGSLVWSGDIDPTFESLARQIRAGLNMAMAGIPWWNTDVGGFHGGDARDPAYRELMVRWFQYGVFTPVLRLHGDREPRTPFDDPAALTGGPNEVWSYGDAYPILRDQLRLRERLRPYLAEQMRIAHTDGIPPMRPVFVDFSADRWAWSVEDEFLLGPDVLVAPVTMPGSRSRKVYLPEGTRWRDAWTGAVHEGGSTVEAPTPLKRIPVFVRDGAAVARVFAD